jgi:VHL beta domain
MIRFMKIAALACVAVAPASIAQAQARDRCNDFANEMLSIDQRAQQLQCRPWTKKRVAYDVNYNWCQSVSPSTVQDSINRWQSEFQRCQFQASGSPAAQPPRPAAQPARPAAPQAAAGLGCPKIGTLRSPNSSQQVSIDFVNNSFQPVKFYWMDFQGQYKLYRELQHGQSFRQRTFVGHVWVAADPNRTCFEPFRATSNARDNRLDIR